ncbi:MAG: asparagine synthase (glutamine-hydrolyzing), partial [Lachnoclostridium sp.]|nr:asparagine synthase (glutamine-hydrolyzing) [Lachnoclostridium sp.]
MSGIAGFFNTKQNYYSEKIKWEDVLRNMNRVQKHRGPDEDGFLLVKNCGLSYVRLSVIQLMTSYQPMQRIEAGRRCVIVFDGEIYNMNEYRKEIEKKGISFRTASDTEILLAGYMEEGSHFVEKLNGVFAIVIWDSLSNKILMYRDRVGAKPLFYVIYQNTLVFSSEIKGLFRYPGCEPKIDRDSLCEIFGLGPAKTYGKGVFKDVREVLPGHFMEIDGDGVREYCYWKLISKPHDDNFKDTVDKTSNLLLDAVKKQMRSDVPIASFLSGGVDSSLVTAICANELKKQGETLNSFSFDYKDNEIHFKANSFQPSMDRPWVERVVKYTKTNHRYLECDYHDLFDRLYEAMCARDLPCMADVESSLNYFCAKTALHNKVVLTGEGADEIFGGYPWFHNKECFESDTFPWSMDLAPRKAFLKDDLIWELKLDEYVKAAYDRTIAETPRFNGENEKEARRREIAYLNIKWFMATLLDRMDRTSMSAGLSARVPFGDHRILEYVWNVPWSMKCPDGLVKGLLRAAGKNLIPHEILYRKKSPYPKTYHPAYEKMLGNHLREVLSNPYAPLRNLVDIKKAQRLLNSPADYGKPWYGQLMAGPQMIAYLLQVNDWLERYKLS